jgi:hypothetical protein
MTTTAICLLVLIYCILVTLLVAKVYDEPDSASYFVWICWGWLIGPTIIVWTITKRLHKLYYKYKYKY